WFYRGGEPTNVQLIYDTDDGITWLDWTFDKMYQKSAVKFADALVVYVNTDDGTVAYDDWRLPATPLAADKDDWTFAPEIKGEMAHLYYDELGNVAGISFDDDDNLAVNEHEVDFGSFSQLLREEYWSTADGAEYSTYSWYFNFDDGLQGQLALRSPFNVMVVRTGEVADAVDTSENPDDPVLSDYEDDCQDGIDNDGDGKIDCADKDCISVEVIDGVCARLEKKDLCDDGWDNDGDGRVDACDYGCDVKATLDCEN
ncbi:MAG: hypothetical protein KAJ60_10960, partial [Desulfobulbaceae bacterium]|nr:hypothetical protein [Desulfobulbaceae bacterium]